MSNAKLGASYDDKFHTMQVGKLKARIAELEEALQLVLPDLPRHKGECVNDNLYLEPEQITFARCDYCIARSAIAEKDDELPD
jgi:hypothetical protein